MKKPISWRPGASRTGSQTQKREREPAMSFHRIAAVALLVSTSLVSATASASTFDTIVNFSFAPYGGANPMSGAFYYHGALYGTTVGGGTLNEGLFYQVGKGANSVINQVREMHSFTGPYTTPFDIIGPNSEPEIDGGVLSGAGGAVLGAGQPGVYQIDLATGQDTLICRFSFTENGTSPNSVTVLDGLIYGTTAYDGDNLNGTIFSVDPKTNIITTLVAFKGGNDGATPRAGLTQVAGVLYGTTSLGGKNGVGTLFSFDPATKKKTILYSFDPAQDGTFPQANMIAVGSVLYGTSYGGGAANAGGVFSFDTSTHTLTTLHQFNGKSEGGNPQAPLFAYHNHLFGSTTIGGTGGDGTLFSIHSANGHEDILHSFSGTDGAGPVGALHVHAGTFYGTTYTGGSFGSGTLFSYTP
jgi:uncharacterized repeat protein (TIGR03803 family)